MFFYMIYLFIFIFLFTHPNKWVEISPLSKQYIFSISIHFYFHQSFFFSHYFTLKPNRV
ncbi:hypothetical protein GLYMA_03G230850v4 [Glycine max]|nr:hypothetical protein GLYMA_03G230850v4 [Glycine max]KAH1071426.1 hypothetical protein GYH30_008123 [Glycine max]